MKKIIILLLSLISCITLTSCDEVTFIDDETGETIKENLFKEKMDAAITEIYSYKSASLFYSFQQEELNKELDIAKKDILAAKTTSEIANAVANAKKAIDNIKTIQNILTENVEKAKTELNKAKATAKLSLNSIVDKTKFRTAEKLVIEDLITEAELIIDSLENTEEIVLLVNDYVEKLSSIKTNEELTKIEAEEKEGTPKIDLNSQDGFEIISSGGLNESIYVEWKNVTNAERYNVYYKESSAAEWKKVDDMLIRTYQAYSRVDVLGLKAGSNYSVKVVTEINGTESTKEGTVSNVNVIPHIREGFAFVNGTSSGAYNNDGTLKSNATVLYITNATKNTVSMDVTGATANPCVGLQNIFTAYAKGKETKPLCVRLIGNITDFATMEGGDLVVSTKNTAGGITIEGVGKDAYANGWGVRLKGASNVEVRNLGLMLVDSGEGDNIGLQQANDHIWIHNNDIFYGKAGKDADQAKGDGALDTKKSKYVTHSYNHFWDTGKSNLVGNKESISEQNFITFHHNWYDHSDSRHPRVRVADVHVYNNLFEGIAKYAIGATMGASILAESNVFKNTKNPFLSSNQGTDALGEGTFSGETGGIIKSFNNKMIGTTTTPIYYSVNSSSFDAYVVSAINEVIPSSVKTLSGGFNYSNFDTQINMYTYAPTNVDDVEQNVKQYAGRMQGGDFKFTFTDADITSYDVNQKLMDKLVGYKSEIITVQTPKSSNGTPNNGGETPNNGGETPNNEGQTPIAGTVTHNFANGKTSDIFTITGNMKDADYSILYDGITLTKGLKMESSTLITFTTSTDVTLYLVLSDDAVKIKVDDVSKTTTSKVLSVTLSAGTHKITKGDTTQLLYIKIVPQS